MPVRQKIFRIELMRTGGAPHNMATADAGSTAPNHEILAELQALRGLLEQQTHETPPHAAPPTPQIKPDQMTVGDLSRLRNETECIRRAISGTMQELATLHFGAFNGGNEGRVRRELDAVVDGTERATQQILEAAEGIDDAANTLSASLRSEQEHALSSDIRDQVVRIFEACNFQDLSGQRIAKVLETLQFVEDRVARMMEIWGGRAAVEDHGTDLAARKHTTKLVGGPKLDGDPGHATQQEIDAMFA